MHDLTDKRHLPSHWYNILPELPVPLPSDLPPPIAPGCEGLPTKLQLPLSLARQNLSAVRDIAIPAPVLAHYLEWRPTPLIRATRLEAHLGTSARIYFKYEGANASGSHKLSTALAQAYYYHQAGVRRLTTGTGAGQWGTALAFACQSFGLACTVYMVGASYRQKPYRKTIMELLGADIHASPSGATQAGARMLAEGKLDQSNIAFAVTEALEDAQGSVDAQLSLGSGETYSILHSTVIGQEAISQLSTLNETPDIVIASLGAGSNFGGIAVPFIGQKLRGERAPQCISIEPAACPKLTRGVYRYDYTDGSGITPLQKMYTLGSHYRPPGMHAGGLRYHACSKLLSALYHRDAFKAVAYPQTEVFASALTFARLQGILPAPESAHAIHGAIQEALQAKASGSTSVILFCLSGHGLFDLSAYAEYLTGAMEDAVPSQADIDRALAFLPTTAAASPLEMS